MTKIDALTAKLFPEFKEGDALTEGDKKKLDLNIKAFIGSAKREIAYYEKFLPTIRTITTTEGIELEVIEEFEDGRIKIRNPENGQTAIIKPKP
jgi:hypothetical protein